MKFKDRYVHKFCAFALAAALTLVLGAVPLLAAAPAEAQTPTTLVSSIGQTKTGALDTSTDSTARGFTTGNGHHGYKLTASR